MIVTLVAYRGGDPTDIAVRLAWAAVIGSALQPGVQVPTVWRIMAPSWILPAK